MIYSWIPHDKKIGKADGVAIYLDQTGTKVLKDSGNELSKFDCILHQFTLL